jgi:hypothetical protein
MTIHAMITRKVTAIAAAGALLAGVLALGTAANAAQIDLMNCQSQQVRVCAWDDDQVGWELQGNHVYSSVGETHHFTCRANCKFSIVADCKNGDCKPCQGEGSFVDHSFGKGTYQLVALDKASSDAYKSADIQKVESGAQCQ